MTDILKIETGHLMATEDSRVFSGLLVPFNEKISPKNNTGKVFAIPAGVVKLPRDPEVVGVNDNHRRDMPLGRLMALKETETGIEASIRFANTEEADALLAELQDATAAAPRKKLSVEIADLDIDEAAGLLRSGRLFGAAVVKAGAFASATLYAAEEGNVEQLTSELASFAPQATPEQVSAAAEAVVEITSTQEEEVDNVTNEVTLTASAPAGLSSNTTAVDRTPVSGFFEKVAAANSAAKRGDKSLFAALTDIVPANVLGTELPQYVGELWSGVAYTREIAPLFNSGALTSFTVNGYRWVTKPKVGRYAGNKTAVPSNAVSTVPVSVDAQRIAGAHDIDRKFRDFNDTSFFESYYRAMTESYAIESDAYVLEEILDAATPVVRGTVPTGVSPVLASIADGMLQVRAASRTSATFALVSEELFRDFLLTRNEDVLAYLNASVTDAGATVAGFKVLPSSDIPVGSVLVGSRSAATVHELGGGAPIRVEALDIANGGVDAGVFGYLAVNVHDAGALALVEAA